MKGCYALVYRRQEEAESVIPKVPMHLADEIALTVMSFWLTLLKSNLH